MDTVEPQSRFLDLPLELRERIYFFSFTPSSTELKDRPIEPPIVLTSKQLRDEALPVFYACSTLTIQTYVKCDFYGHCWMTTRKWYHHLSRSKLRYITNFRIRFILVQQYTGELVPLEFQLSLHKRNNRFELTHSFDKAWFRNPHRTGDPADFEDVVNVLRAHLTRTLDCLVECPGIGRWTAADFDRLAKVEPESLPLTTS
jgi:hypothetical protein